PLSGPTSPRATVRDHACGRAGRAVGGGRNGGARLSHHGRSHATRRGRGVRPLPAADGGPTARRSPGTSRVGARPSVHRHARLDATDGDATRPRRVYGQGGRDLRGPGRLPSRLESAGGGGVSGEANPVYDAIRTRRVTRQMDARPVEPADLDRVVRAARYAPSAGNRRLQPVIPVSSPRLLQLLRLVAPGMLPRPAAAPA